MKRACLIGIVTGTLIGPATAGAQGGAALTATRQPSSAEGQAAGGGGRIVAGAVQARITTGRPYSAEAVTERTQVLGDGNRIDVRSTTRVYRDGEGRTRREMLDSDGTVRSISISDPVSHTSFTLDPATKIAYKTGGNIVMPQGTRPSGTYTMSGSGRGGAAAGRTAVLAQPGQGRGGGRGGFVMRELASDNPNRTTEDLGPRNIEGVMAAGTRTTTVIPAGEIGNVQPLQIVSEQWFSEEIEALVMTRHSDPRSGENVYRLRNILRAEPDPTLFSVPADYTIQQRGVRRPQ